jgi:hypothetical protein
MIVFKLRLSFNLNKSGMKPIVGADQDQDSATIWPESGPTNSSKVQGLLLHFLVATQQNIRKTLYLLDGYLNH